MTNVPLALEGLTPDEIELVCEVFRSGNLTMGDRVREFELEFAQKFKSSFAVMVNSGSSANLLALEVLRTSTLKKSFGKKDDQFVAVPAVLWPTSLWPIIQLGFKVLLIDSKPNSLEIDFDQLLQAKEEYGSRLIGAVLIHPLGQSLDLNSVQQLQQDSDFFVLEDNCESIGSGNNNRYAGTVGDFGSFSFYYSHHMTTVEGGMITTNNEAYANELLSMRAHGWTRNRLDKKTLELTHPSLSKEFLFVTSGFNVRPMEFQGALGSSQLRKLDSFIAKRIENAKIVDNSINQSLFHLIGSDSLRASGAKFTPSVETPNSWMALPITVKLDGLNVNDIRSQIEDAGISTRPILAGDFSSQPASGDPSIQLYGALENSKSVYRKSFMIGNHHNYSKEQIELIGDVLVEVSNRYE
jgi:CDP-6-deoxy-D-xylo-4-hexulose-3-dehydrase